jgi:3-oxoadipate enol-lactonase
VSGGLLETVFVDPAPRLAVSVAGTGTLVLFLHGIRGNRRNWSLQLEFFSRNYKAAAWDARGYGDSDDYEGPLQFDHFSGDVLRVAEHFRAPKMHLVGLSMGGRIARNFALAHPERVRSLTLANTSPGFDALSPEEVLRFVEERKNRTAGSTSRLLGSAARTGAHEALLASFHALHNDSYRKTLEASVAQDRNAPLEKLAVPTLVITGDEDRVYPLELTQLMARRIPRAKLVVLEACGHLSNLEQPERFNAVLLDFLRQH